MTVRKRADRCWVIMTINPLPDSSAEPFTRRRYPQGSHHRWTSSEPFQRFGRLNSCCLETPIQLTIKTTTRHRIGFRGVVSSSEVKAVWPSEQTIYNSAVSCDRSSGLRDRVSKSLACEIVAFDDLKPKSSGCGWSQHRERGSQRWDKGPSSPRPSDAFEWHLQDMGWEEVDSSLYSIGNKIGKLSGLNNNVQCQWSESWTRTLRSVNARITAGR